MMRHKATFLAIGAIAGAVLVGPFMFHKGQGPAIRFVSITPLGPGRAGGVLPLLVDSKLRDGCIPMVARSLTRMIRRHDNGKIQIIKFPLTNVPLVAYDPVPPPDLVKQFGYDSRKIVPLFLPMGIPNSNDFGTPLMIDGKPEPWRLQTDGSPLACGWEEMIENIFRPQTVGARDVAIDLLPAEPATLANPPAAARQDAPK